MRHPLLTVWMCLLVWLLPMLPALALDLDRVEAEIHRLSNVLRAEKDLPPLAQLPELDGLARRHSNNMARQQFFAHQDPEGLSPSARMQTQLPGLLTMGSGENIAMRSSGADELTVARALVSQWRNSPGHYRNIISPDYLHLGVGIADSGQNIYATQVFAAGLVLLKSPLPASVSTGESVALQFRFLANFAPEQLSLFLTVPDKQARFPASGGSFYTGGGPLIPQWQDASHFTVTIPSRYGLGQYRLGIGRQGSYYNTPYQFEVVAPSRP
ncbi:MAG: hypothetical protein CVV27_12060 [Candidatus Melainabacteria bacterium HGW-Melainabacteria-1]|nr:MAG: hypothetical protein CVV27_12060 [Candidatus Melainabacteria bacterium HGW-Melainabacteria-1]